MFDPASLRDGLGLVDPSAPLTGMEKPCIEIPCPGRLCDGEHTWERYWDSRGPCDCPHCEPPAGIDLRRLECERCPAELRPEFPGFETLWAKAPTG